MLEENTEQKNTRDGQIIASMVDFYHEAKTNVDPDLQFLPFLVEDPNAYLLGVIYNQGMSADYTWTIPEKLAGRLGHFDMARMVSEGIEPLLSAFGQPPALHRYRVNMAKYTLSAAQLLVDRYEGSARNIWVDAPTVQLLYERLDEFKGMGPKKINMMIRALVFTFGAEVEDPEKIDLPIDIHARRVFLRAGLVANDNVEEMVNTARRLHPSMPAELDLPVWLIGRRWCFPVDPSCSSCVISENCRKLDVSVSGQ